MTFVRRILGVLVLAAAAVALVLAAGAGDEDRGKRFFVELDNAFGLVDGADVKVAGVRAGVVKRLKLDQTDMRAVVEVELNKGGFDDLRSDVTCETRPQSLIGEYFIDCRPGRAKQRLEDGATIPVERTETTVPLDLINDIMRRPVRERYTILLSELGAGLAARGDDLDKTIRRAVPALRQVDRLLAILAEQKTTIRDLYRDADRVFAEVAGKREDVARFVEEARDTAAAASQEQGGIADQWRTFPTFLRELRPTLAELEETADAQIPALRNLNTAAPELERLFKTLGPYSEASRPAIRSLGDAAQVGREAVTAARAPVAELRKGVDDLPEASKNLAITLEHLDDPKFATEKDVRAGRGKDGGYTGLEAFLRYVFSQSQAINVFDANSYILKVSLFLDRDCANYTVVQDIKSGRSPERCRAWLGRNQPGITSPDPTKSGERDAETRRVRADRDGDDRDRDERDERGDDERGGDAQGGSGDGGAGQGGQTPQAPAAPGLPQLDDVLPGGVPSVPDAPAAPSLDRRPADPQAAEDVLDFLLGS